MLPCDQAIQMAQEKAKAALARATPPPCTDCKKTAEKLKEMNMASFSRGRMLADGSVIYAKKGVEPPPDMDGFQRDPGNAWHFLPIWPSCTYRLQTTHLKQCGAIGVLSICRAEGGEHERDKVTCAICESCLIRKAREESN